MSEVSEWVSPGVRLRLRHRTNRLGVLRRGLFLDRDGVLIEQVHHLHRVEDVRLQDGVVPLLKLVQAQGVPTVVVTNQSGIDRGIFGWSEYESVEAEIDEKLSAFSVELDAIAVCPFHPEFTPNWSAEHARWRKPGCGMLRLLAERLNIDLARSWMIGDAATDIEAARAAGLQGSLLVLTGHGRRDREAACALATETFTVKVIETLSEAARHLPFLAE